MQQISVIVPCFNEERNIGSLVDSVINSSGFVKGRDEIIIADDCSTDGSREAAAKAGAHVVCLAENSGPAAARNLGVASAKNEILLFLDSDTLLESGSLDAVRRCFSDPGFEVDIVNGLCCPEPINMTLGSFYKGLVEYSWHLDALEKGTIPTIFNSRVGAIRKAVFEQTGGFDVAIRGTELEEHEFSYRLPKGTRFMLCPDLKVRHDFPDFINTIKVYWKRSAKWTELFFKHKQFDNGGSVGGTSMLNAFGHLFGVLAGFFLLMAMLGQNVFLLYSGAAFFLFVAINRMFFSMAFQKSLLLGVKLVILHLVYSFVILGGAVWGGLRLIFPRC
ncbi:MAG: glycosyltransferase [Methylobacter sp.]|nr:glycosyltransferase [Methylobacter sp.]